MAKKESLRSISKRLGLSPSTVYRSLNSCGDVSSETSACVRQLVSDGENRVSKWSSLDCAIILPSKPNHFWRTGRVLFDNALKGLSHRFFLYADPTDEKGFCSAFFAASSLHPKLAIAVAPDLSTAREALTKSSFPIFFFNETFSLVNSFFFGSDPYADGYALGQAFVKQYPQCRALLCLRSEGVSSLSDARTEGFQTGAVGLNIAQTVSFDGFYKPYAASLLARNLAELPPFDSVFCDTGNLPDLCLALQKCRIPVSVPCVGFENSPLLDSYRNNGRPLLVSTQDMDRQVECCTSAVRKYLTARVFPDQKYNTIPSLIV